MVVEAQSPGLGRVTLRVQRDGRRFTVEVGSDGEGLVSHAGAALLAEAADRLGLKSSPGTWCKSSLVSSVKRWRLRPR